jgi:hypothetical protein
MDEDIPRSATVFTPQPLAAAMVQAAGDQPKAEWLDPCVGDGAFVAEMAHLGVPPARIQALDISLIPAYRDSLARTLRGVDFIEWATHNPESADRVVMNPPYVALNRLRGTPLEHALQVNLSEDRRLPLRANYWCAFILCGLRCLRPEGTLVAVLPASWEFAQYATHVREKIFRAFKEVTVLRCTKPLFPNVQEGSVVVVARRRGEPPETFRRVETVGLDDTASALREIAQHRMPERASVVRRISMTAEKQTRLGDILRIRIGAVTGDSHYFLLTEAERRDLGLPQAAVRPVLSRSRHLTSAVITQAEWASLRDAGERIWMFRPSGPVLRHPAVDRYLQQGQSGACDVKGYKVRSRVPWHHTPLPGRVDGFLSGMSKRLPFLVLREMEHLTATNTLYIVQFRNTREPEERAAVGIALLTSAVRRELARHARVYADGLVKFEPTELGRICIPTVKAGPQTREAFEQATALLLAGEEAKAEALADTCLSKREPFGRVPTVAPRSSAAK